MELSLRNDDFLLKNDNFLWKNVGFILKNVGFTTQQPIFLLGRQARKFITFITKSIICNAKNIILNWPAGSYEHTHPH